MTERNAFRLQPLRPAFFPNAGKFYSGAELDGGENNSSLEILDSLMRQARKMIEKFASFCISKSKTERRKSKQMEGKDPFMRRSFSELVENQGFLMRYCRPIFGRGTDVSMAYPIVFAAHRAEG